MNLQDACMEWKRLGDAVLNRRARMGMASRAELARRSGISLRLLTDLELGHRDSYDPATFARLEQALEWAPGSAEAILEGGHAMSTAEAHLAAMAVDPRAVERYGDDIGIMSLVAGSGLSPGDAMRLVLRIRRRRAEQYDELQAEVRRWIVEAGGDVPAETQA